MKICMIAIQIQTSPNMSNAKRTTKISNRFTELIDVTTMDHTKLYFESPQELEIQQGNKTIKYYKIPIGYQQKGGVGECVISIPMFCHCFGIEEFQNESGKVTAHGAGLSMIDNNASAEDQEQQLQFVKSFVSMVEIIKKHLFSVKKDVKKPTLDASDLKVYFSAVRQQGTNIEVYYKVLGTGDPSKFDDRNWTRMQLADEDANKYSRTPKQFLEYQYKTPSSTASYTMSDGTVIGRFHTFAVKVVLRTDSKQRIPRLKNLRVIALDE